ncbi:MAG: SagB/ThcOx family dehydrogenase [Planctomycetota bacterium]|jgi:SagB-type dehydrogenase family enzyme
MSDIGDKFQKNTKYDPVSIGSHMIDWSSQPPLYKQYPNSEKVKLPAPIADKKMSLDETLKKRKSIRHYSSTPLSLQQLSYLLWASTGIQRIETGYEFRTAPSAGALYPIETYIIANNITGLQNGLYHYDIKKHQLELLKTADLGEKLTAAALGQSFCATAPAVFLWSAIFQRSKFKYHQRAYRYIYLDAGHVAENLALSAVSLDLGSCQIGAFLDDQVNEILSLDGATESILYLAAVGTGS